MDINKGKTYEVTPEMMARMLRGAVIDRSVRIVNLPKDARITQVVPTDFGRTWKVLVLSETFDEIPEGGHYPKEPHGFVAVEADDNGWHEIHTYDEDRDPEFVLVSGVASTGGEWMDRGWFGRGVWYTDHSHGEVTPTHWRPFPPGPKREKD